MLTMLAYSSAEKVIMADCIDEEIPFHRTRAPYGWAALPFAKLALCEAHEGQSAIMFADDSGVLGWAQRIDSSAPFRWITSTITVALKR